MRFEQKAKPGASEREGLIALRSSIDSLGEIDALMNSFNRREAQRANRVGASIGVDLAPGGLKQAARSALITGENPKLTMFFAMGNNLESKISRAMSGLALTRYEIEQRQNWSPFAPGITLQERKIRVKNMQDDLKKEMRTVERLYGTDMLAPLMEGLEMEGVTSPEQDMKSAVTAASGGLNDFSDEALAQREAELMGMLQNGQV